MDAFDDITNELDRIGINVDIPIVHAIFIKDHSSSMGLTTGPEGTRAELALVNFNKQLEKMQSESGEIMTTLNVVEFSDKFRHTIESDNVSDLKPLDGWVTGGMTALRDAIGEGIGIGKKLIHEYDGNDQSVLFFIFTDGEENVSVEWSHDDLKREIKTLEESKLWTFTFIGGELQASEMVKMGMSIGNTMVSDSKSLSSFKLSSENTLEGMDKYYTMRKAGETQTKSFFKDDEEEDKWQQKLGENT